MNFIFFLKKMYLLLYFLKGVKMNKHVYLDNVVKNFLDNLVVDKPLYEMTSDEARDFLVGVQQRDYVNLPAFVEDFSIFSENVGDISIRLVKPEELKNEVLPLVIYCHGGGWVVGDADVYDMTIKTIAKYSKSAVAFVNYSRSPEYKYPVALNQIYETVKYFTKNGINYGINSQKIAIVGDSAGGNLANAVALRLKNDGNNCLSFLGLIYPVCDTDMNTKSYGEYKDGPWLSKKSMEYFFEAYLKNKEEKKDIFVSPLKAEIDELVGLPETLIVTAENDVLRDEGEEYARKLIEADVNVACIRVNNTIHDFMMLNILRESMATHATYKVLCRFLEHNLYK